ncbi:MSMEG_0570 family nitrogen starvation response protein [Hymenobacter sp.]|jgi:uncharacterized repeat protein (TIGR04042 family)|uniref:MSMEG_0570 family nitrogen starvation response protein n=1 Tax=Hymenobacter sp. TaxID=1898978 RepID=UPI002EDA2136
MPETYVRIAWPNGQETLVYSPSSIIREYFQPATELSLVDFQARCTQALDHASRRVQEVYGYECSASAAEKYRIDDAIKAFQPTDANQTVKILAINS